MTCNNSSTYTAVSQRYEVFGLEIPRRPYPAVRRPAVLDCGPLVRRWITSHDTDADTQTVLPAQDPNPGGNAHMDSDGSTDAKHRTIVDPDWPALLGPDFIPDDHCANADCICHIRTIRATPAGSKFCPVCNALVQRQPK